MLIRVSAVETEQITYVCEITEFIQLKGYNLERVSG